MFKALRNDQESYLQLLYEGETLERSGKFLVCELVSRDRRGFKHTRLKNELRIPLRPATVVDLTDEIPEETEQLAATQMETDEEKDIEGYTEGTKRLSQFWPVFHVLTQRWMQAGKAPNMILNARTVFLPKPHKVKNGMLQPSDARPIAICAAWWRLFASASLHNSRIETWIRRVLHEEVCYGKGNDAQVAAARTSAYLHQTGVHGESWLSEVLWSVEASGQCYDASSRGVSWRNA